LALDKEIICRVPERKHSSNHLALGKEPNSASVTGSIKGCTFVFNTSSLKSVSTQIFIYIAHNFIYDLLDFKDTLLYHTIS
jgi:hypothetical protein